MEIKTVIEYTVMVLCFVFAGISIILIIYQYDMLQMRAEIPFRAQFQNMTDNDSAFMNGRNMTSGPGYARPSFAPIELIASYSGLAISLLAGFSLFDLLKRKEKKELTKKVIDTMLTPEEKQVIRFLEENNDEMTQSELVSRTKLSKVKISRVIKRLESLKAVSKFPYGMTNKIKLEKRMYEK
jgi:uncharacterized membrane protein